MGRAWELFFVRCGADYENGFPVRPALCEVL